MIFQRYFCNFRLMLKNIMQNKHIMILHTILLFLTTTLPSIVIYSGIHERYTDASYKYMTNRYNDIFEFLSFSTPYQMLITVAAAIITSFCCYSYLNSPKSLIFHNSMPYKRSNVYFTRFLSGIVQMAIPVIIIFAVNSAMYFGYDVGRYAPAGTYASMVTGALTCIFMYILTFSVGAFTANISSNVFAQGISILFVFLAYILSVAILAGNVQAWFDTYYISFESDARYIFPPSVIAGGKFTSEVLIYDICYFALFTALGCIAAVKRATENSNKFFAFGFIKVFMKYYISLFASLGFGLIFTTISNNNVFLSLLGYIMFGFLAYSILQAIFEKNIRAMFTNLKGFTVFAVILIAVLFVPTSGILNLDNHIPGSASEVTVENASHISDLTLKDPANIAEALKLAEAGKNTTLEYESSGTFPEFDTTYIRINFGNKLVSRVFGLTPTAAVQEFIAKVYGSDECKNYLTDLIEDGTLVHIEKNNITASANLNGNALNESKEKLKERLAAEINALSYDDIKSSYIYAYVSLHMPEEGGGMRQHDIPVYSCYKESVALIKDKFFLTTDTDSITELKISGADDAAAFVITDGEAIEYVLDRTTVYYHSSDVTNAVQYEVTNNHNYVGAVSLTEEEVEMLKK